MTSKDDMFKLALKSPKKQLLLIIRVIMYLKQSLMFVNTQSCNRAQMMQITPHTKFTIPPTKYHCNFASNPTILELNSHNGVPERHLGCEPTFLDW